MQFICLRYLVASCLEKYPGITSSELLMLRSSLEITRVRYLVQVSGLLGYYKSFV